MTWIAFSGILCFWISKLSLDSSLECYVVIAIAHFLDLSVWRISSQYSDTTHDIFMSAFVM